jgi:hypothetical protein
MTKEREWGQDPVKQVDLTDDQRVALFEAVVETMKQRKQTRALKDEPDYLCGAMAVIERLGIPCPMWPIFIMTGRSLLDEGGEE